jgi:putative membrane protein
MMRSMKRLHIDSKRRLPVVLAIALTGLGHLSGAALTESLRGSSMVGLAAAQQADRVVPPAALTGRMAAVDEAFALFIASSSLAQIEGARLVLKSTKSADVVDFAQRILRDHTEALERLKRIAAQSGLELPPAATGRHADLVTKLAGVAPADRDDAFIHRFGLDAHKEAIALTERHVKEASDPELRRYAEQVLETLREHMSAARKLAYAASAR